MVNIMPNITKQELKNYCHIQAEIEAFDAVAQDCRQRIAQLIEADKLYQQAAEHFCRSRTQTCVKRSRCGI